MKRQHEERSHKIKQFITQLEQVIQADDCSPPEQTQPISNAKIIKSVPKEPIVQKEVPKRRLNSFTKRGKADLSFLRGII